MPCEATIDENFKPDVILVITRQTETYKFLDYTVEDFPYLELESVRLISYGACMKVKAKMLGKDIVMPDGTVFPRDNDLPVRKYNHILALTLKEQTK